MTQCRYELSDFAQQTLWSRVAWANVKPVARRVAKPSISLVERGL